MGRLLWIGVGGLCGVALSENKELVGSTLFSLANLTRDAAGASLDITVQGTKLSDVPVLGSILQTLADLQVDRAMLQQGVDHAHAASKEAVRQVSEQSISVQTKESSGGGGRMFLGGLALLLPACAGAYIVYDEPTRQKALIHAKRAREDLMKVGVMLQNDCKIVYNKVLSEAPVLYGRAQREAAMVVAYTRENVPKLVGIARAHAERTGAYIRENGPRIYHQVLTQAEGYYAQLVKTVDQLAAKAQAHAKAKNS